MSSTYSVRSLRPFSSKITSNKHIRFLWLQPYSVNNMAAPPPSSSQVALAASLTARNNVLDATAVVSTPPTLATEFPLQAVTETSSAQTIVASPIQAVFLHIQAISSPTRAVALEFTRSDREHSCKDESLSSANRVCSCEKLLRTRLEIPPICGLASPPIQGIFRGGRETSTVSFLPSAASTLSVSRKKMSKYLSSFQY